MVDVATTNLPTEPVPLDTIPVTPVGGETDNSAAADKPQNGDIVTVFDDAENFNVKHPLANEWTLWFTKPPSGKVRSYAWKYF